MSLPIIHTMRERNNSSLYLIGFFKNPFCENKFTQNNTIINLSNITTPIPEEKEYIENRKKKKKRKKKSLT